MSTRPYPPTLRSPGARLPWPTNHLIVASSRLELAASCLGPDVVWSQQLRRQSHTSFPVLDQRSVRSTLRLGSRCHSHLVDCFGEVVGDLLADHTVLGVL